MTLITDMSVSPMDTNSHQQRSVLISEEKHPVNLGKEEEDDLKSSFSWEKDTEHENSEPTQPFFLKVARRMSMRMAGSKGSVFPFWSERVACASGAT